MTDQDLFPASLHGLTQEQLAHLSAKLVDAFQQEMALQQIDTDSIELFEQIYLPLTATLAKAAADSPAPLVIGINGAQGSGKTTLCRLLKRLLHDGFGLRAAEFSIDDLYLTRAERLDLSRTAHPLLATRGVPGTHDVALGLQLLEELKGGEAGRTVAIPVFDKARDDRAPRSAWRRVQTPIDLVLFEGWCVGAIPQLEKDLPVPVNILERDEDPQATWRRYVNHQLQTDYARLFTRIDLLIMLAIPDMACVYAWRGLQERKLAAGRSHEGQNLIMDQAALERFIMHYERLTRSTLEEMPRRADLVLHLDKDHHLAGVRSNLAAKQKSIITLDKPPESWCT